MKQCRQYMFHHSGMVLFYIRRYLHKWNVDSIECKVIVVLGITFSDRHWSIFWCTIFQTILTLFTVFSRKSSSTIAGIIVDLINACCTVLARMGGTFVNIWKMEYCVLGKNCCILNRKIVAISDHSTMFLTPWSSDEQSMACMLACRLVIVWGVTQGNS